VNCRAAQPSVAGRRSVPLGVGGVTFFVPIMPPISIRGRQSLKAVWFRRGACSLSGHKRGARNPYSVVQAFCSLWCLRQLSGVCARAIASIQGAIADEEEQEIQQRGLSQEIFFRAGKCLLPLQRRDCRLESRQGVGAAGSSRQQFFTPDTLAPGGISNGGAGFSGRDPLPWAWTETF
jgi:hypothetical protein